MFFSSLTLFSHVASTNVILYGRGVFPVLEPRTTLVPNPALWRLPQGSFPRPFRVYCRPHLIFAVRLLAM